MNEQKAREILGVGNDESFDDIKHTYKKLIKKYHPDNMNFPPEESRQKFEEVEEAYQFLKKLEQVKIGQNRNNKPTSKGENEKSFDDLVEFIKKNEAELKKLNTNILPKYKKELLNSSQRGIIEASILNKEKERLSKIFSDIINNIKEFDRLKKTIENARKQIVDWNVNIILNFKGQDNIDPQMRGKISATECTRIRNALEKELEQIRENIEEFDSFFTYIKNLDGKIKIVESNRDIEYLIQKYSNKKGIISAKELKALKKQIQNTIDLKEKSISEFLKFYEETETRLKDLYNADLRMWKEYNNVETLYDNSEENLNSVQREIEIYEKKLEERANAYDEFLFYYDDLSKEEQEEYKSFFALDEYLDKRNRTMFEKAVYDELKEKISKYKKETKEERFSSNAFEEFNIFFNTKEDKLKKIYGIDLSKWKKYTIEKHDIKELEIIKQEILEFEKDLQDKAKAFDEFQIYYESLTEEDKKIYRQFLSKDDYTNKENRVLFDKKFFDDLKEQFLELKKYKKEQEKKEHYLKAKAEFISFFYEKEELFKRLYEIDLYKWRKYSLKENNFTEEEYLNVKKEIENFEKVKENERMSKLYNLQSILKKLDIDIAEYLSSKKTDYKVVSIGVLSNYLEDFFNISYLIGLIKDLEGGEEKLNIYLKEQSKTFWTLSFEELYKKLFDLYTEICIEVAKEEEQRNKKEKANSFTNFRNFYQEKKRVFKELYNKELSKWDSYTKEENKEKYSKKDYEDAINEIKEEEKKLEEERMSLEYNLQVALRKAGIDIAEYLNIRGKNILSVSKFDLKEYLKEAVLLLMIINTSEGQNLLTSYLEENNIRVIEADYSLLLNIYRTINVDMTEQDFYDEVDKNGFKFK